MPDFSQFLSKPAGEAKKPPVLPMGDYPGIVKGFEYGDSNRNKTPYVRFQLGLTGWGDGIPEEWSVFDKATNKAILCTKADVDLSKKTLRRDFYLTEDALYRLDELIRGCGIVPNGQSYEELIPNLVGASVLVEVQQQLNETSSETFNQVGKVVGAK